MTPDTINGIANIQAFFRELKTKIGLSSMNPQANENANAQKNTQGWPPRTIVKSAQAVNVQTLTINSHPVACGVAGRAKDAKNVSQATTTHVVATGLTTSASTSASFRSSPYEPYFAKRYSVNTLEAGALL